MIRTKLLRKVYTTEEVETTALDKVSVEIKAGELVALMGPSGCGKSTFLNLLGLLDNPTDGEVFFCGEEVSAWSERRRTTLRKGKIGFVFQSFNLIDELTIHENVELPLLYLKVPAAERRERVQQALAEVNLSPRADHFPQQLSGGQQQRAAVARAIISEPPLILADEPTGNLDSAHGDEVMSLLTNLNANGTTVVMVTHSETYADYCRRVIRLFDGRVVAETNGGGTSGGNGGADA